MRAFLSFLWLCVGFVSMAHNAKIATYTLRDTGVGWMIEINFAQAGLLAMAEKDLGETDFAALDEAALKSYLIEQVQQNFSLEVDGINVPLKNGGVLMGNHQTNFKYVLPEIPLNPQQLMVHIPMCSNVHNQTNIFRIYRGGEHMSKFFLSEDNDFEIQLEFSNNQVIALTGQSQAAREHRLGNTEIGMIGGLLLLALFGIFQFRRSQQKNEASTKF